MGAGGWLPVPNWPWPRITKNKLGMKVFTFNIQPKTKQWTKKWCVSWSPSSSSVKYQCWISTPKILRLIFTAFDLRLHLKQQCYRKWVFGLKPLLKVPIIAQSSLSAYVRWQEGDGGLERVSVWTRQHWTLYLDGGPLTTRQWTWTLDTLVQTHSQGKRISKEINGFNG